MATFLKTPRGGVRLNDVHPNKRGVGDKEAESVYAPLDKLNNVLHGSRFAGYRAVQPVNDVLRMEQPRPDFNRLNQWNFVRFVYIKNWVPRERHAKLVGQLQGVGFVHPAVIPAGGGVANHGIHPIEPRIPVKGHVPGVEGLLHRGLQQHHSQRHILQREPNDGEQARERFHVRIRSCDCVQQPVHRAGRMESRSALLAGEVRRTRELERVEDNHRVATAGGGVANHGIHPIEPERQLDRLGVAVPQELGQRHDGQVQEARRRRVPGCQLGRLGADNGQLVRREPRDAACWIQAIRHGSRIGNAHDERERATFRRHGWSGDGLQLRDGELVLRGLHSLPSRLNAAGGGVAHGLHSPKPRIGESDTSATRYIDIEQERVHRDAGKLQRVREGRACDHQNKAEFERYTRGLHVQSVPDNWIQGMPEHYCWRPLPRDTKFYRQCLDISRYESYGKLNIRRRTGGVAAVALAGVVA